MNAHPDFLSPWSDEPSHTVQPPEPRVRLCFNCQRRCEVTDEWKCSSCNFAALYSTEFDDCPDCNSRRRTSYKRNKCVVACNCTRNAEQRANYQAAQDAIRDEEVKRKRDEADRRMRELEIRQHQATADDCWSRRGYHCELPREELFAFCKGCVRFRPREKGPPSGPIPPPQFEDETFEEFE